MTEAKFLDSVLTVVNRRPYQYSVFYSAQPYHNDPKEDYPFLYEFKQNHPPDQGALGTVFVEINDLANLRLIAGKPPNIHNAVIRFALQSIAKLPDKKQLVFNVSDYERQREHKLIKGQELKEKVLQFIYFVNQELPTEGIGGPNLADNFDAAESDINDWLRRLEKAGYLELLMEFRPFRIRRGATSLEPYMTNPQKEAEIQQVLGLHATVPLGEKHKYFNITDIDPALRNGFVFVIMPFTEAEFPQKFYYDIVEPVVKEVLGLPCGRADKGQTNFAEPKIFTGIIKAKLIIADLSTENRNVIFEFGMALAREQPIILLFDNRQKAQGRRLAFDYDHFQTVFYNDFEDLRIQLTEKLKAFRD